jgi:hypothetical protein
LLPIAGFVLSHKITDRRREFSHLKVAASAQFVGYVVRNVF